MTFAGNHALMGFSENDGAPPRARLEVAAARDFLHERRQLQRRRRASIHAAADSRQRQQLTDEGVQPGDKTARIE
jgi:hypothetical protein